MALPILTTDQMREWENATWATGITEASVIERVGQQVASAALKWAKTPSHILVLAGKGHNGDDARAAESFLANYRYTRWNITDPAEALEAIKADLTECNLIIDGLFGIGISRPLDDTWQKLIHTINASGIPVLSIDVPSGLNADTGEPHGAAIEASVTLTVGTPKRGMLSQAAQRYIGRLEVASEVGLVPCPMQSDLTWVEHNDFKGFPPMRKVGTHKGTYGHLAIFAGSMGYHGAAILSTKGALQAQSGLVSLFTPENIYVPVASQLQAAMVHPWKEPTLLPKSTSAILFGPGLASADFPERLRAELVRLWTDSPLPVIADASALDWLPACQVHSPAIRLITPHPGEAARMLSTSSDTIQQDRPAALRQLSTRFGNCWVVLKGHQTLVGRGSGEISVNSSGNPHLAQGGTGDILAGFIGGLLAQPELQRDPAKTIRYAVWQHGASADALTNSQATWTSEDLAERLGPV